MIQKPSVTSGTLVSRNFISLLISDDPRKNTAEPKGPAEPTTCFYIVKLLRASLCSIGYGIV